MIESRLGPAAEIGFLRLVTSPALVIVELTAADYQRIIELIEQYADMGLGTVDASIVAVAERLGITTVATLNRRDLTAVCPTHVGRFEPVP